MNALLPTLLEEFEQKTANFTEGVIREVKFPNMHNKIKVAVGMRRTGKTHFLMQTILRLLEQEKITLSRILYVNFEDDRLYPLTARRFSDLLDGFYAMHPENHDQLCYLFLDEVQNIEHWQMVVRRYFDTKKVQIFLTGSSAKLLSKEIATSLRGRSIMTEVWPFNFTEFLQAKGTSLPKTYGKKNLDKLIYWLKHYIKQGGFPEVVEIFNKQMVAAIWKEVLGVSNVKLDQNFFDLGGESISAIKLTAKLVGAGLNISLSDLVSNPTINQLAEFIENNNRDNRRRILQTYVTEVILRDIVERHKITNLSLLHYMRDFLLKNVGKTFSVHKFYNDAKSQALAVSKTTIHDYLSYIEDAYLAFMVPLYSESLRQVQSNPRKIYAIDTGLVHACTFSFSENIGRFFENLIYLDLRRAGHKIYYYLTKTRKEVDFLTQDLHGKWHLFQVCWDIQDAETKQREMAALDEAETELKLKGECITPSTYFTSFLPTIQR